MRTMTEAEQTKLLKTLAQHRFAADMMTFDAICYGGQLEQYRDARNHIEACIKAIPEDIRNAYDASLRKSEADKLRAKADALENGAQGL